jgi:rhamnosyltransferase
LNNSISAIIIAYFPDEKFIQRNIKALSLQVDKVFIINNTPEQDLTFAGAVVVNLGDNVGIARAQNIGLELSIEQDFKYSILFDQDSDIDTGMVESMLNKLSTMSLEKVASIGPRAFDLFEGKPMTSKIMRESNTGHALTAVKQIIASGQLIPLHVLSDIGFMDETLFIDVVDHEWCWRAGKKGYKILVDENCVMKHRLGDSRKKILGFTYKIGSPIRLYYQFRNTLRLMLTDYVPLYWKARNVFGLTFKFIIFSTLGPDRKLRLKYMVKGILHSIIRKTGKYS